MLYTTSSSGHAPGTLHSESVLVFLGKVRPKRVNLGGVCWVLRLWFMELVGPACGRGAWGRSLCRNEGGMILVNGRLYDLQLFIRR